MYKIQDINEVHIEITQRCQAACSMCDRNEDGGVVNKHLTMAELTIDDIKAIFKPEFIKQLRAIQLCGNYGDPIIAKDTLEVFQYFREHNSTMWFSMNTNAGARSAEWWAELATVFGRHGNVIFSLDGLEDTNHLYRQNVQWSKVKQAFTSFIAAGGRARWDFLVFDYNEHQVEEARQYANKIGFEKFIVKKSSRFISGASIPRESHQAFNIKGEKTTLIKKPKKELQNKALSQQDQILKAYGTMDKFYDVSNIECKVKKTGSIYLSAEGMLMPCCWTAGRMYKWWNEDFSIEQIWDFINKVGGKDALNAKFHGLAKILESSLFDDIENSWEINGCKNGRLKVCAMKCSKEFDIVESQYKDNE